MIWWALPSPVGGDPELDINTGIPLDSIVCKHYVFYLEFETMIFVEIKIRKVLFYICHKIC
jgi:hypothetical protein